MHGTSILLNCPQLFGATLSPLVGARLRRNVFLLFCLGTGKGSRAGSRRRRRRYQPKRRWSAFLYTSKNKLDGVREQWATSWWGFFWCKDRNWCRKQNWVPAHLRSLSWFDPEILFSLRDGWGLQSMLRKGGALRGHSDAVLMYQNGSGSFRNHTAVDIRAGTGVKGWWFLVSGTGFSGVQILVLLACAGPEMHPSSGHKGEKTNEH